MPGVSNNLEFSGGVFGGAMTEQRRIGLEIRRLSPTEWVLAYPVVV
jgi:hypothetical protein